MSFSWLIHRIVLPPKNVFTEYCAKISDLPAFSYDHLQKQKWVTFESNDFGLKMSTFQHFYAWEDENKANWKHPFLEFHVEMMKRFAYEFDSIFRFIADVTHSIEMAKSIEEFNSQFEGKRLYFTMVGTTRSILRFKLGDYIVTHS